LRQVRSAKRDELAARLVLRSLARRIEAATEEASELEGEILTLVRELAPQLLEEAGVGPIVAAQLIVAWSHRGRLRSEAAFARLQRPDDPSPPQPWRRPPAQPRPAHGRPAPSPARPGDQGLHCPPLRRGQEPPRGDPAAQTLLARRLYRLLQNQEPLLA
jgi:hypothetical protein